MTILINGKPMKYKMGYFTEDLYLAKISINAHNLLR